MLPSSTPDRTPVFLSAGFRPFFLLAAVAAVGLIGLWVAMWIGAVAMPSGISPISWHAHEMVYGFVGAAVAGFLFTAVPNWTGRATRRGVSLGLLALLWLGARFALYLPQHLPTLAPLLVDGAFPLILLVWVSREILLARNRPNLVVVAVLMIWAFANLVFHGARLGGWTDLEHAALMSGLQAVLVLVVLIGGRVIPAFTGNWLRQAGGHTLIRTHPLLDRAALPVAAATGVLLVAKPDNGATAALCIVTGVVLVVRLSGWRGLHTLGEPLLFVLHVAYGWLSLGYLLTGLSILWPGVTSGAALHALTIGGIGTMILAMMSRAALGHTGRPLTASGSITGAYLLLTVAALTRSGASMLPGLHGDLLMVSGTLWVVAFAVFTVTYWPVLVGPVPPPDGRPGVVSSK